MKGIIRSIIREIPKGNIFDSHTVIFLLIQQHSDEYLKSFNLNLNTTELYHAHLGKIIAEFENDPVDKIERIGESYSKNIHDTFSPCACWRKL